MASYLILCQETAAESGIVASGQPVSVTGQVGQLADIVRWVRDAYDMIQRSRADWTWMVTEFAGATIPGKSAHSAADLGIVDRFGSWVYSGQGQSGFTIQDGENEGELAFCHYEQFRAYVTGSRRTETGRPQLCTINNEGKLAVYPIPAIGSAYTIRGQYRKSPQVLAINTDIPDMPLEHHNAIRWQALILCGVWEEASNQIPGWQSFFQQHRAELMRDYTPRVTVTGPLA